MLDKEITRKQFLLSIGSIVGVLALSGVPKMLTNKLSKSEKSTDHSNGYGNQTYGGNA